MTGEELSDEEIMSLFEAHDGLRPLLTINHGDLFMPKEIQNIGISFSV